MTMSNLKERYILKGKLLMMERIYQKVFRIRQQIAVAVYLQCIIRHPLVRSLHCITRELLSLQIQGTDYILFIL